jgi:hypothetical protein
MFPHLEYIEYCNKNNLFVEGKNLNTEIDYYWYSNFNSDIITLKYIKLNGNTFIFQIPETTNKIGLSSEDGLIYGLSYEKGHNMFEYWKYS